MCQMSVLLDRGDNPETVMENVSLLEVTGGGVRLSTLFDTPKTISGVIVTKIDFMNGKVYLGPAR